jgi:hypothetical protein
MAIITVAAIITTGTVGIIMAVIAVDIITADAGKTRKGLSLLKSLRDQRAETQVSALFRLIEPLQKPPGAKVFLEALAVFLGDAREATDVHIVLEIREFHSPGDVV